MTAKTEYIVIRVEDTHKYLSNEEDEQLVRILDKIDAGRIQDGIPLLEVAPKPSLRLKEDFHLELKDRPTLRKKMEEIRCRTCHYFNDEAITWTVSHYTCDFGNRRTLSMNETLSRPEWCPR